VVHRAWGLGRLYMGLLFSAGATALYGVLTFFLQGGPEIAVRIRGFHTFYVTNSGLLLLCTFPALLFACSRGFAPSYRAGAGIAAAAILAAQLFGRLPSAWLGTGAGLLILALRRGRPRLAALVPMLAVVLLLVPGLFRETARDLLDPSSPANASRARIWENGWRLFASDVWSGAGLQDLREEYRRIVGPGEEVHGNMASVPVHVAASMGAPGLVALAWLVVAFFRTIGRARQGAQGDLLRATVDGVEASLVAFLAAGLLEWNLGDSEILALLCFLVGTAIAAGRLGGGAAPRAA
ncbi:MAG: O-antigen ligase family protein, partial [bacterium]